MRPSIVRERQAPLLARYRTEPEAAFVIDGAVSAPCDVGDPFHDAVLPQKGTTALPIAAHAAHGGPHDAPTPGDMLCAALACCHELTIRMVANTMGLEIVELHVEVRGEVDVRGSLTVPNVPVGFQKMRIRTRVRLREGGEEECRHLIALSERLCVVGQTLRKGVPIESTIES